MAVADTTWVRARQDPALQAKVKHLAQIV